jgi:hypothetical protein
VGATGDAIRPSSVEGAGGEGAARVGEVLYRVGDPSHPFMAIVDSAGNEPIRHGSSGFLGELNLLSGQTVFRHGGRDEAVALPRGREGPPTLTAVQLARTVGRRSVD